MTNTAEETTTMTTTPSYDEAQATKADWVPLSIPRDLLETVRDFVARQERQSRAHGTEAHTADADDLARFEAMAKAQQEQADRYAQKDAVSAWAEACYSVVGDEDEEAARAHFSAMAHDEVKSGVLFDLAEKGRQDVNWASEAIYRAEEKLQAARQTYRTLGIRQEWMEEALGED